MKTIQMVSKTNDEGALDLHVLTDMPASPVEVVIVVGPAQQGGVIAPESDWAAFINQFSGICADAPLERGPQGDYEIREPFA